MPNDLLFCNGFSFNHFQFTRYKYTDNRAGTNRHYFGYMEQGSARICVTAGETVHIAQGQLFFLPLGCRYQSHWQGNPQAEFLSLGVVCLPNFEHRYYPPQTIDCRAHAQALSMMRSLADCDNPGAKEVAQFYALTALLLPDMTACTQNRQEERIEQVKSLLRQDPRMTVAQLCRRCAISESTLYATFKDHSPQSIHEIRRQMIMWQAKRLLVSTDLPIQEISWRLGFSSDHYFRKCFSEQFGVSPRQMRKEEKL